MKTIAVIKRLDIAAQFMLLLYTISMVIMGSYNYTFFLLPAWQLLGAGLHALFHFPYTSHHRMQAFQFMLGFITLAVYSAILIFFWANIIPATIVAYALLVVYYMYTCFDEIRILHRKSIVHLK